MNSEADFLSRAKAHVALCSDPVWAPNDETNAYRRANQELWVRSCRIQKRYESGSGPPEPLHMTMQEIISPVPWEDSNSTQLQTIEEEPLVSFSCILSKNNRQWLGTSNWLIEIKKQFPKLEVDLDETKKKIRVKNCSTFYEDGVSDKDIQNFSVKRYVVETAEEKELEKLIYNKGLSDIWNKKSDAVDSLFILPADLQLSLYNLGTQFTFQNSPLSISPAESSLTSSTQDFIQNDTSQVGPIKPRRRRTPRIVYDKSRYQQNLSLNVDVPEFHPKRSGSHSSSQSSTNTSLNVTSNSKLPNKLTFSDVISAQTHKSTTRNKAHVKITSSLSDLTETAQFPIFKNNAKTFPILPSITEPKFQSNLFSSCTFDKLVNIDADECSEIFEPLPFMTPMNTTVSVSTDSAIHSAWINSALSSQKDIRFAETLLKPSLGPNATTPIYSVVPQSSHLSQIPISSIYLQESTRTDNKPMFISHSSRVNENPINFRPIPIFQRPPEFYLLQNNKDLLANNILRARKPTSTGFDYNNLVFLTSSPNAGHSRSLENVRIPRPEISRLRNAQYNQDFLASGAKSGHGKRLSADKTQKEIEVLYPPGVDASSPIAKWLQTGYPTRAKDFGHVGELLSGIIAINASSDGSDTSSVRGPHNLQDISQDPLATSSELFPNLKQKATESKTISKPASVSQQPPGTKKKFKTTFSAVVPTVNAQILSSNHNSIEPKKRLYSAVLSNSTTSGETFPSISICQVTPPLENISSSDLKVDLKCEIEKVITPPAPILNKTAINTEFPKLTSNCKPVTSKDSNSKKTVSAVSIEKCYDELERQAIEQYKDSDESLNSKYFQELERQALEQYSASSQSICNTESHLVMNAEAYYETNEILNEFDDEPGTSIGDNTDSDNVNATKIDPFNLNYIRLNKTTQKKSKSKKKTKKSNLKNCFSPRTGAEYPAQSDPKDIKELHIEEQKMDIFLLYYTHKNLNFVLKLVTDEVKLSSHLKSFFIDFKAGAIPGRFRIFELLATAENGNKNGNDLQFIPMEDYNFVDINCITDTIDHNMIKSSVAYFEDNKIDVFLELICMTNNRKINKNIRLLVPCQTKIDNLKKIPRKKITKKEVVTRKEQTKKPKNISKNQSLCKESKFFLRYIQLGMKPICDRPLFCQFLFQSCEHIEYNKPNILEVIRFEEIHKLIEYIQTVWKRLKGRYTSGVFHDYIPCNMAVKLWSPTKYYTGHRRFSKSDYDLLKRRTFDNLYRISINGKEYFQPPPKQPTLRKYFSFIDHNELKSIIEYEKSFFDHRQGYGITCTEMLKMLKIQPNDEELEEAEKKKTVCFHKRVSKVLRHVKVDFEYLVKINTGCIVDYYRFFEYRDDDLRPNASFIYHLTADILQISFLYNWGFLAVDQVICDPWMDNSKKFKAIKPHIIPIITPSFITRASTPKIIFPKPKKPDKQILNLPTRKEKNVILKLSEQQKSDLKSTIALTLNREIKTCGQKDLKDDVQKIARTLSELIKRDIIEKLKKAVINKKLQNEKDIEVIIHQSAEDIHRRIINSTFAETVLETCRIKKQKDKDMDTKEQILSAMSDYISQSYANLAQKRNRKDMADKILSHNRGDACKTAPSNQNKIQRKKPVDIAVPEIIQDIVKNSREQSLGVMTDPIINEKCGCELAMEQFKTASDSVQNLCRDNNQNCKGDYEMNGSIAIEISREDSCCQTGDDGRDFECKLDPSKTELSQMKLTPRKKKCESQRKKNINKIDARNDISAPKQRCSSSCNSGDKQHTPPQCLNSDCGENIIIDPECNGKADESGDLPSYMKTSAKCEKVDEVDLANKITKYSPRPNRKYQRKPDSNTDDNQASKISRRSKLLINEEKDEPPYIECTEDFSEKKNDSSCLLM